ncbi:polysaccharide biosynthesis/export family protein [uncultured Sphingomonas sp.]|uniref:polysaccharide biosynthesis/export family protein n=1 Tax=uncultured Sphingomonas sp. TaxID=158754 RepID=UPI0035C98114
MSTPDLDVVRMEALPIPTRPDLVAADRGSYIGPLDTIAVDVFNVAELSRELRVDSSGRISMPLVGEMDVRAKTANEVAREIETALGRYVRQPQVTVNVRISVSQVVTVDGSVNEPGLYPVTNQTTLVRAIASAKGLAEFGESNDVVILRTVNSRRVAGLYNLDAIRRGAYQDPAIYANDLVIVGDSKERRLFRDFIAIAPLLTAPLIIALQ